MRARSTWCVDSRCRRNSAIPVEPPFPVDRCGGFSWPLGSSYPFHFFSLPRVEEIAESQTGSTYYLVVLDLPGRDRPGQQCAVSFPSQHIIAHQAGNPDLGTLGKEKKSLARQPLTLAVPSCCSPINILSKTIDLAEGGDISERV